MNKHVPLKITVTVGLLFSAVAALAAPPHSSASSINSSAKPNVICATCGDPGGGGSGSVPPSLKLSYISKDPVAETITLQFSNGLTAVLNFNLGIATLDYQDQHTSMPLDAAISAYANGDPNEAAAMYSELQDEITLPHSGGILSSATYSANGIRRLPPGSIHPDFINVPGLNTGCDGWWDFCDYDPWAWWNSIWGPFDSWWDSTLGWNSPGSCPAWDAACRAWNERQLDACNRFGRNAGLFAVDATGFLVGCFTPAGEVTLGVACYAGVIGFSAGSATLLTDYHTCNTPY